MNPKLIAIAGALEGKSFAIVEDEIIIGRDRSNSLWINDASVSRKHCCLIKQTNEFHLKDLQSHNGTRVNSIPIQERKLEHGDLIAVGDSLFLFLSHDEEQVESSATTVHLYQEMPNSQSTIQLRIEDAIYLHPEKVLAALPTTARIVRDLNALLHISNAVNSIQQLEPLQQALLESIFEVVPAERALLLISSNAPDEFKIAMEKQRFSSDYQPLSASRTIVHHVIQEGIAILSNDILSNSSFNETQSLIASQARSILCIPLTIFGKVFGAIYLDTTDTANPFDENHLQLVTAIASMAAIALNNAQRIEDLKNENQRLQEALKLEHNIVGESEAMRKIYQMIAKVAPADSTVLIDGESGTGKELAARAIHQNSVRASRPFVAINCAALTDTLLESELFGHEKGAFTGAIAQKKGKLEIADGGTVFLDEIGELAPILQAKLLRVLQERELDRVGGTRPIKINIRLIAATNRKLEDEVQNGRFRQDLFYRLNVVRITMPPLRERLGDIPLLARYFVVKYSDKCKRTLKGISPEARGYLNAYSWQGNVRELENTIERAVVLGTTEMILPEDLPECILEIKQTLNLSGNNYHQAVKKAKQQLILNALELAEGNYIEAAKSLSIHPNNLHRLIRDLELKSVLKK